MTNKIIILTILTASIAAQSGGPYVITENVIATGGGTGNAGSFGLSGTSGQGAAGQNSFGGQFSIHSGFWKPQFVPTAVPVSISGRVTTAWGNGITNVSVSVESQSGLTQRTITGPFGYYRIEGLEAGGTYIVSVGSKRFTFANSPRVVVLADEITELNFIAGQ